MCEYQTQRHSEGETSTQCMFVLGNSDDVGTMMNCVGTSTHWNNDNGALEQRLSLFKHFFLSLSKCILTIAINPRRHVSHTCPRFPTNTDQSSGKRKLAPSNNVPDLQLGCVYVSRCSSGWNSRQCSGVGVTARQYVVVPACMFVDVPGSNTHTHFYRLKFHIRQECVVAIVRVMEAYASTGIVCHYSRYIVCTSRTLRNTYMYSFTITLLKL